METEYREFKIYGYFYTQTHSIFLRWIKIRIFAAYFKAMRRINRLFTANYADNKKECRL